MGKRLFAMLCLVAAIPAAAQSVQPVTFSRSLPEAPTALMRAAVPKHKANFNRWDYALYAGVVAYRAGDYFTTERNLERFHHNEWELPHFLVASKGSFAAFTAGMVLVEGGSSIYLHKHGHAKLARLMDSLSVAGGVGTDISNVVNYRK